MYIFVASEMSTYIRLNNDLNMLCCVLGRFTGPVTSLRASRGAQHLGPGSTLMAKNVQFMRDIDIDYKVVYIPNHPNISI